MAVQTITYIKGKFVTGAIPTQADFTDLVDTVIALAQCKTATFTIALAPTGPTQKPTGATLQDDMLANKTILDVMTINNLPLQWRAAGVTYNSSTGTFDFTATGALYAGDVITISYI